MQTFGSIVTKTALISREDVSWNQSHALDMILIAFAVDYNSWQESPQGLKLAAGLDKDVVLAEGAAAVCSCGATGS